MARSLTFPDIFNQVTSILSNQELYLVGGAIRDALLDIETRDLDFAMPGNTIPLARKVADHLDGAFYVLDEERDSARVILDQGPDQRLILDFTTFQGHTILEDLKARDFTITAMAVSSQNPQQLIDPLGGISDLQKGILRACSSQAMEDDPLRILRGLRMALAYDFRIVPQTKAQMRRTIPRLGDVSPERRRDEFFLILEGPQPGAGLKMISMLHVFPYLLPDLGAFSTRRQRRVRYLRRLWDLLSQEHDPEAAGSWAMGLSVLRLGRYRKQIRSHYRGSLVPDRRLPALVVFASLHLTEEASGVQEKPTAVLRHHARYLRLSNEELEYLEDALQGCQAFLALSSGQNSPSSREVYRYFQSFSAAGVDAIFLGLADILARHGTAAPLQAWPRALDTARTLLEAWWERREEVISPPALLSGHDLMDHFGLDPGPEIGSLLAAIREEQAVGKIATREGALDFARKRLSEKSSM